MASKFHDCVGYSIDQAEVSPGVFESIIVEKRYFGDIRRMGVNSRLQSTVLEDVELTHQFSLMVDPFAYEHANDIVYIKWHGVAWSVRQVLIERPRLVLRTGGVYHGQTL